MKKQKVIGIATVFGLTALLIAGLSYLRKDWPTNSSREAEPQSLLSYQKNMQKELANAEVRKYGFLEGMYQDEYYPKELIDKGREILIRLCKKIEAERPSSLDELYSLTHAATEEFNKLGEEFVQQDSEIETVARDIIGEDFQFIAKAYEFPRADKEELIAPRDW